MITAPRATPQVDALALGLRIIDLICAHDLLTITEAAALLSESRSRTHRSLLTLQASGYVVARGRRGYAAGPKLLALTMPSGLDAAQRFRLRPILQRVFEETGEAVHSSVLVGDQLLVIDGHRSRHQVDIGLRVGMSAPAYAMAGGKLLLAQLVEPQIAALYPFETLSRRGPRTIATRTALLEELRKIRATGYAMTVQESERGVNSVATLLAGNAWRNRIAIVVSMPVERGRPRDMLRARRALQEAVVERGPDARVNSRGRAADR